MSRLVLHSETTSFRAPVNQYSIPAFGRPWGCGANAKGPPADSSPQNKKIGVCLCHKCVTNGEVAWLTGLTMLHTPTVTRLACAR